MPTIFALYTLPDAGRDPVPGVLAGAYLSPVSPHKLIYLPNLVVVYIFTKWRLTPHSVQCPTQGLQL